MISNSPFFFLKHNYSSSKWNIISFTRLRLHFIRSDKFGITNLASQMLAFKWKIISFLQRHHTKNNPTVLNIIFLAAYSYIISVHYDPSVRIIELVPDSTYIVCINFINEWWDQNLNVDSERQIFFCQKSVERKS